jgi:hypothetical protein
LNSRPIGEHSMERLAIVLAINGALVLVLSFVAGC